MKDQNETVVMTVQEVATLLKLGESTVYRLAGEGKIPGRKIGGNWRFLRTEINDLLRSAPLEFPHSEKDSEELRRNRNL